MKNNKQKLLILVVLLAVVIIGGYLYFSGDKKSDEPTGTLVSSNSGKNPVDITESKAADLAVSASQQTEIETLLKSVNQIKLDTRILQDPAFLTLMDTTLALPDTPVTGRVNPFARSGALDAAAPVETTSSSIVTNTTTSPSTSSTNTTTSSSNTATTTTPSTSTSDKKPTKR